MTEFYYYTPDGGWQAISPLEYNTMLYYFTARPFEHEGHKVEEAFKTSKEWEPL